MFRVLFSVLIILLLSLKAIANDEYQSGLQLFKEKNYKEATATFKRITEKTPKDANAWFNLALCYQKNNAPIDAICAFETANKLNPSIPELSSQMNHLYEQLQIPYQWSNGLKPLDQKLYKTSTNTYLYLLLTFVFISLVLISLFILKRKRLFLSLALLPFLASVLMGFAYQRLYTLKHLHNSAVVLKKDQQVYLSEKGNALVDFPVETIGVIPGNRLQIGEIASRTEIILESGEHYWMDSKALYLIK